VFVDKQQMNDGRQTAGKSIKRNALARGAAAGLSGSPQTMYVCVLESVCTGNVHHTLTLRLTL
jgi:hypothetical protein